MATHNFDTLCCGNISSPRFDSDQLPSMAKTAMPVRPLKFRHNSVICNSSASGAPFAFVGITTGGGVGLGATTGLITGGCDFWTGGGGTAEQAASRIDENRASASRGRVNFMDITNICHGLYELQPNEGMPAAILCDERFALRGKARRMPAK